MGGSLIGGIVVLLFEKLADDECSFLPCISDVVCLLIKDSSSSYIAFGHILDSTGSCSLLIKSYSIIITLIPCHADPLWYIIPAQRLITEVRRLRFKPR